MAGIQIRVTEETVTATLTRVERVADNPAEVMEAIASYLVTSSQRHIERERGPEGAWPSLSPRTAAARVGRGNRRRGTENMLRVTGRLYASLTSESGPSYAAVGTSAIYGAIQQLGGSIDMPARSQDVHLSTGKGRKRFVRASAKRKETRRVEIGGHSITIPARPYLYLDDEDRTEIERVAAEEFRREAGL